MGLGKTSAWLLATAVVATAGVAHAQEGTPAERAAVSGAVPWYERFTTSSGVTESVTGTTENDRLTPPTWTLSQRWGVTVDVRQAQRVERGQDRLQPSDQTSVGAYYQFTPRVRVGGEVSVAGSALSTTGSVVNEADKSASVKLESAFKF